MKRSTMILVGATALAVVAYFAMAQRPQDEGRAPDHSIGRQNRSDRGQPRTAQRAPAKSGRVASLSRNPDGDIDGLRLDEGTEVRFPAEAGEQLGAVVSAGDQITVEGWTHPGESEIHAATIRHMGSGKLLVVDRPPPEIASPGDRSRPEGTDDEAERRAPPPRDGEGPSGRRSEIEPRRQSPRDRVGPQAAQGPTAQPAPPGSSPTPSRQAAPSPMSGFVRIPAGEFLMGDHHGFVDPKHGGDETPIHRVHLDAFDIGIDDVTTEQYCTFLNSALEKKEIEVRQGGVYLAGGDDLLCDTRQSSPSSPVGWDGKAFSVLDQKEKHPMICVRWQGAAACCNWLSTKTGCPTCYRTDTWECDFNKSGFRLPTEAEWEYAARGGLHGPYYNYPWGDDPDPAKANVPESRHPFRAGARPAMPPAGRQGSQGRASRMSAQALTTPVGFYDGTLQYKAAWRWPGEEETFQTANGANGFGLHDMAGNVWQWCTEWYDRDYYAYAPADNPPGPAQGSPMPDGKTYRAIRGGSWFNGEFGHSRVSNRDPSYFRGPDPVTGRNDPDGPWFHIGFRVVRPVDAERRPTLKPTPVQRVARRDGGPDSGPESGRRSRLERRPRPDRDEKGAAEDDRPPRPDSQRSEETSAGAGLAKQNGAFFLRSSQVAEGGTLPKEFTGDGQGATLPLEWGGAPAGTRSFALIMHHLAPDGIKWYWVLYNIPSEVTSLPKNVRGVGILGNNSIHGEVGYAPPHSKGPGEKKYTYTIYALSSAPRIRVAAEEVSRDVLLAAIKDLVLASAELNVVYARDFDGKSDSGGPPPRRGRADDADAREPSDRPEPPQADDRPPRREDRNDTAITRGPRERRETSRASVPVPGVQTVGLFTNSPQACPGYTLFAPKHHTMTYLMDNEGRAVHRWDSKFEPGQSVYLLENGHLLHCCFTKNKGFTSGGEGGRLEEFDWDGNLVWEFEYSTDQYLSHHDIKPLPNGNVLVLAVEKKSYQECLAAGFSPDMLRDRQLFPEFFVEVQPTRPKGGKIVWQWHVWDHLIQDNDPAKANYGEVAKHPERIDVHCNGRPSPAFWNHGNAIAYNPQLDQIMLSARGCNEIWIVDHGTTTEEAAAHSGGRRGKGGDLLYRWGNPAAYGRGSSRDRQLFQQHDAQWIPEGYPGAGHILIFNNGLDRGYSTVEEIVPPLDPQGNYLLPSARAFGPARPVWRYQAKNPETFYSAEISGAHRLPNGNTLICAGVHGEFLEVTPAGETVWRYVNPVVHNGILAQGESSGKDHRGHGWNAVFKIHRYEPDYPGLAGRTLTPLGPIEQPASLCGKTGFHDQASEGRPMDGPGPGQRRPENRSATRDDRRGEQERRPPRARPDGDEPPPRD